MNWSEWLSNPETREAAIDYLSRANRESTGTVATALTFGNPFAARLAQKAQQFVGDTAKGAYQAVTLPGRALTGQIGRADEIPLDEAVGESLNFAGMLDAGAIGAAAGRGGLKAVGQMPGDRLMMGADGSGFPPPVPSRLYHGTDAKFGAFDDAYIGSATDAGMLGRGHYFSTDPNIGRTSKRVLSVDASVENPLKIEMPDFRTSKEALVRDALGLPADTPPEMVTRALRERGHDGVVLDYSPTGYKHQEVMVPSAGQVKIAESRPNMDRMDPRERLREAYDARAAQMDLPPDKRIQPDPSMSYLDRDYQTPMPGNSFEDLSQKYPRNPDPAAKLPLGDRARVVVDNTDAIAERLAEKIRAAGQMDADTRYFYHSDGPLYRGARKAGLDEAEATAYVNDLGSYVAATSPRTKVEENVRNATSAMAKTAQGIPHREIVGPGSGGISERGYPMMTDKGGIHGQLLDDVIEGRGIDPNTNSKPNNFGQNLVGNRSSATVDTHAIRGTLITLNELQPGSVAAFILPEFKDAYLANPSKLTPDMIADTLGSQVVKGKGKMQTEYPVFADVMHKVAERLGVSPAEAQSMAWFGLGGQTNLGSSAKTVADVFDERLSVTAQALGIPVEEAARRVYRRQIPLLATGGGAGLLGGMTVDDR